MLLALGLSLQAVQAAAPTPACADMAAGAVAHLHGGHDHADDGGPAAMPPGIDAAADDAAAHCDAAVHAAGHHDAGGSAACDHCQHCGAACAALMPRLDARATIVVRTERLAAPQASDWASVTPEPLHRPPIPRAA